MGSLRLTFLTFCNAKTGYGHWFRSLALAKVAHARGHHVTIASDTMPPSPLQWIQTKYNDVASLVMALNVTRPDWLIVDLPDTLPAWIEAITPGDTKICVLNGIGYDQFEGSTLRVIQGPAETELPGPEDKVPVLKGLEYVIIRPELEQYRETVKDSMVFVWAGGNDKTGLNYRYSAVCSDWPSVIITSDMTPKLPITSPNHLAMKPSNPIDIFKWMAGSKRAVVNMGMCIYELAYLQVKTHCFNASELHLRFALAAEKAGLLKTWHDVGLPDSNEQMRDFLETDYEMDCGKIDLKGATRVIKEIEKR